MKILFCICIVLLMSCQRHDANLRKALHLAGDNRPELEKVLQHYSQKKSDSLKLRAAKFLIENMPGHCTLVCPQLEAVRKDSMYSYYERKVLDICAGTNPDIRIIAERREDVQSLTSDFLIRHIEASFALLENYSWNHDIPFDLFLEYLLPYRLENEELDLWRDSLLIDSNAVEELNNNDDLKYDISRAYWKLSFQKQVKKITLQSSLRLFGENITSDCRNIFLIEEFKHRALGIPAALDYLPFYPNRNGYHYWSTVISAFRKKTWIEGAPNSKAAKVYRRTFSHQSDIQPGKNEYIPDFFRDPFNKDVTNLYFNTTEVAVHAKNSLPRNLRYAYLCVFNNLTWQPIAISDLKGKTAVFKDMGKDIAYLPVYYQGRKRHTMDYPFTLMMNGKVRKLIPDTSRRINLHLIRKYPYGERVYFNKSFEGACLEASVSLSFREADTILELKVLPCHYIDQTISLTKQYRYWRVANPNSVPNIAELIFWDQDGKRLEGKINDQGISCLDGDPLTCAKYKTKELVIDFGTPVSVSRIVCLPRNDGNGIYPGDEYELFFYDKEGWVSLGRKTATDYFLDYEGVPANALYWLRNLTCGMEERIFTSENGKIRFW